MHWWVNGEGEDSYNEESVIAPGKDPHMLCMCIRRPEKVPFLCVVPNIITVTIK